MSSNAGHAATILPDAVAMAASPGSAIERRLQYDALAQTRSMRLRQQTGIAVGRAVFIGAAIFLRDTQRGSGRGRS